MLLLLLSAADCNLQLHGVLLASPAADRHIPPSADTQLLSSRYHDDPDPAQTLTWLGSIVQKGKFSAGMLSLVSTLNSVLLPTFGIPTIPICSKVRDARTRQRGGRSSRILLRQPRRPNRKPTPSATGVLRCCSEGCVPALMAQACYSMATALVATLCAAPGSLACCEWWRSSLRLEEQQ